MTTVVFIAGSGRSGSTLLARMLATVDGAATVGEARYVFQRGVIEDRPCGCGEQFSRCPYWTAVMGDAFPHGIDAASMHAELRRHTQLRQVPRMLRGRDAPAPLRDTLGRLYAAMARAAVADVVIDSSKLPTYAAVLAGVAHIDLRVIHLIRDPRAAAFSWSGRKALPDHGPDRYMQRQSVLKSALLWDAWNSCAPPLLRRRAQAFVTLRYEDLIADPTGTLDAVRDLVGGGPIPRVGADGSIELGVDHTVAGNPDRLVAGRVTLRRDDRWFDELAVSRRVLASALTAPLLGRFGYPLSLRPE